MGFKEAAAEGFEVERGLRGEEEVGVVLIVLHDVIYCKKARMRSYNRIRMVAGSMIEYDKQSGINRIEIINI